MSNYQNFSPGGALYDQTQAANGFSADNPDLLVAAPALAVDALSSPSPSDAGNALTAAAAIDSAQKALNDSQVAKQSSWWQTTLTNVGHSPIGGALAWLGKPLQEIQKDYKFIHALYTENIFEGLAATAGVAAGAFAGTFVGDPFAGAAAAAVLERQIAGHTGTAARAYALSENPNYKVSFGRDLANLMQAHGDTDHGWGKIVSGLTDTAFDFTLDPIALGGRFTSAARAGTSLKIGEPKLMPVLDDAGKPVLGDNGEALVRAVPTTVSKIPLAAHWEAFDTYLKARGAPIMSPDQVDAVFKGGVGTLGPAYRRALTDMSRMDQAEVALRYPVLARMTGLVAGKPIEQINDVIKRASYEADLVNLINGPALLPARSLLRRGVPVADNPTKTVFGDPIPQSALARRMGTFTNLMPFHPTKDLGELTNQTIDVTNDAHALDLYRQMRWSMSDTAAKDMLNTYLQIPTWDIAGRKALVGAIHMDTLKAFGLPETSDLVLAVKEQLGKIANGTMDEARYDHGYQDGEAVNQLQTDRGQITAGIFKEDASTEAHLLNYPEVIHEMRQLHVVSSMYGKADEFASKYYTNLIFKPLALLRPAFAFRVAVGEQIQSMIRYGAADMIRSKIASTAIKSGYKLAPGEIDTLAHEATMASKTLTDYEPHPDDVRTILNEADPVNHPPVVRGGIVARPMQVLRRVYGPGLLKMARTVDPESVGTAAWARMNLGQITPGATSMGHGLDYDMWKRADNVVWLGSQKDAKSLGRSWSDGAIPDARPGVTHTTWAPDDPHFLNAWHLILSKRAANPMARNTMTDVLGHLASGKDQDTAWRLAEDKLAAHLSGHEYDPAMPGSVSPTPLTSDPYVADKQVMVRGQAQSAGDWAHAVTDSLRNTVTGKDGTFHQDLATNLAKGIKPDAKTMDAIDTATYPAGMAGRRDMPFIGKNPYERIVTWGYGKVLGPIVDSLSREPLFIQAMQRQLKTLDYAVQTGRITGDEAHWLAAQRATMSMLPQIHNPMLRSQFSVLANNYLPFWFAQEQAYKRFGKLALANPEAIRRYQMIYSGLTNTAFVQKDASGNGHIMIPGAGWVGKMFIGGASLIGLPVTAGLPMSASGATSSLQSVLPETNLPGVSPILGLAMKYAAYHNEALSNIVNKVDPYASNSDLISTVLPSSPARDILVGLSGDEGNAAFANSYTDAIRAAYYHGQLDGYETASPHEQEAMLNRIKNNTRSVFIYKALLGAVSPLSPSISQADPGLRKEFLDMVTKAFQKGPTQLQPDGTRESSYTAVIHDFLAKHGSKAVSYTISSTVPSDPGYIPLNNPAIEWIHKNQDLINGEHGLAASFLVPQTNAGGDVQAIQDELVKDHLRSRLTPDKFMEGVYTAAGNNAISLSQKAHDDFVKANQGSSLVLNQEYNQWQQYVQDYGLVHPLWWKNYGDSTQRQQTALESISGLLTLYRTPNAIDHSEPQVQLVGSILNDWLQHEAAASSLQGRAATTERHAWQDYLRQKELDTPALAPIIRTVFLALGSS